MKAGLASDQDTGRVQWPDGWMKQPGGTGDVSRHRDQRSLSRGIACQYMKKYSLALAGKPARRPDFSMCSHPGSVSRMYLENRIYEESTMKRKR